MNINKDDFRSKVTGCWMGKNIGGTIGAPMEWRRQVNDVSFYQQELTGEPLPNDDLDIQLLWLVALEERGIRLTAHELAEFWCLYVTPHWSEYGIAKINMRSGLMPPICGTFKNDYKDSCGAFIRSEIWACITPGMPQLAAHYAMQDGILDHGNGEGTYAEIFCATLESAAFVISDIRKLIEIGMSYIPDECGVAGAIKLAIESYDSGMSWLDARHLMLEKYRGQAFFGWAECISKEDMDRGFFTGKRGWDVPSNIGMLIIALLYGEGDFAKTICTAVNCGEDTDCTAATAGAIFGILHGIESIPQKWIEPIGRTIKTACLNLGELGYFGNQLPADVDVMTDRTIKVAQEVISKNWNAPSINEQPTSLSDVNPDNFYAGELKDKMIEYANKPVFKSSDFEIFTDYDNDPLVRNNEIKTIIITIHNIAKIPAALNLQVYSPDGWEVTPRSGAMLSLQPRFGEPLRIELNVKKEIITEPVIRMTLELSIASRPFVMHVPIVLLNGNMY
jgi:ADP-ribosylglycohydrolase